MNIFANNTFRTWVLMKKERTSCRRWNNRLVHVKQRYFFRRQIKRSASYPETNINKARFFELAQQTPDDYRVRIYATRQ